MILDMAIRVVLHNAIHEHPPLDSFRGIEIWQLPHEGRVLHQGRPTMKAAFCITAIAAVLSLAHSAVHAQSVRGRVVDALTTDAAPLAMVTLVRADSVHARAITAANGEFALPAPTAGDWTLRVELVGYHTYTEGPINVHAAISREFLIRLQPDPIKLEALSVGRERGRDGFERRRGQWDRGTYFDGLDLALLSRGRPLDLISRARGFTLDHDRLLRPFHVRGCLVVFLDNTPDPILFSRGETGHQRRTLSGVPQLPFRLAYGGMFQDLDHLLEDFHIRGVEMYRSISDIPEDIRGGFRAHALRPIGEVGGCGAVIIWTNNGW
jgi:hypothetical protein